MRKEDLIGREFGLLRVTGEAPHRFNNRGQKVRHVTCVCLCGKTTEPYVGNLRQGISTSCGCLMTDMVASARTKHGYNPRRGRESIYAIWPQMRQRCQNPNCKSYKWYGARGISVCGRWDKSFENFVRDMGDKPHGLSLDRIGNDGNYEPRNCRWATVLEQVSNKRKPIRKNLPPPIVPLGVGT